MKTMKQTRVLDGSILDCPDLVVWMVLDEDDPWRVAGIAAARMKTATIPLRSS